MDDLIYEKNFIYSGICFSEKVFLTLNIKFLHSIYKNSHFFKIF